MVERVRHSVDNSLGSRSPSSAGRYHRALPWRGPDVADRSALKARPAATTKPPRVASLDALRGFNIFWILGADAAAWALRDMAQNQGPILRAAGKFVGDQFDHAAWEGFRFYDFIFPLFIFVIGVSIVYSLTRIIEREGKAAAYWRVLRRSLLLFVLGILFYGGLSHHWPDVRLLGVLQRLALCYLFASLLFLSVGQRGLYIAVAALLAGYWALLTFVPVPGVGPGSYAEGTNLANWIDQHYLPGRKWVTTWDPEGLLSTLPAIATCVLGIFAGQLLRAPQLTPQAKSLWLVGIGFVLVGAGELWGLQFPIIKNIWTSSFALVAGGYSFVLLGVFHQIIDVWGWRAWAAAFVWIGANAIMLYFLNGVANFAAFATRLVGGDVASFLDWHVAAGTGRFAAAVVGLAIAIALANFLYRRKIFLRV
jgi:predicted acyltransferase